MEIINRLNIDGNVNAILVQDSEVKYPVFLESLHTKALFDQLVQSGYRLCGLPYDFKKNGAGVSDLPVVDYSPTQEEFQEMFDMNDMPRYTQDELRTKLSVDDIKYIPQPPANYRITTREEFLSYLKDIQTTNTDDDFLPINYFVHPNARFTVDEWRSGQYQEYFNIMEARRTMSYWKFLKLRNWLIQIGMPEDGDAIDICQFYCMWGIEGLNIQFISMRRKTLLIDEEFQHVDGLADDAYELVRIEDALVDRYGAIFAPEDITPGYNGWVVSGTRGKESAAFRDRISRLKDGEYDVVRVRTKTTEDVLYYEGLRDTFKVKPQQIVYGNKIIPNFRVMMPDVTAASLAPYWWGQRYDERVKEMSYLRAIAQEYVEKRKVEADVSSYKALLDVGCDVKGALTYIVDKLRDGVEGGDDEDTEELPTKAEIELYLSGENEEELTLNNVQRIRYDTIKDIVSGAVNIDGVQAGILSDNNFNVDLIYKYLYCAHFCKPRVSIDAIKNSAVLENNEILRIPVGGGTSIVVPYPEVRAKLDGYKADVKRYKVQQAKECCGFLKVVQIAKEYGVPECDRHVAFEAKSVNFYKNKGIAKQNLEKIMEVFEHQLAKHVPLAKQPTLRLYKRSTCMQEYFRVAEEGCMRLPKDMGGETINFPMDFILSCLSTVESKITSTVVYCSKLYEDGLFTHYCTNADITPYRVYPKPKVEIPAASFPGAWYDWTQMGSPQIGHNLQINKYLYPGFIPWTRRYEQQRYFNLEGLDMELDLTKYMRFCNKDRESARKTEEYNHAPHMESLLYGVCRDEDGKQDMGTVLRGDNDVPELVVSVGEVVTKETYAKYRQIETSATKAPQVIKRFKGFDTYDFDMIDVSKVEFPRMTEKFLSVDGDLISTDVDDNIPAYTVSQMIGMGYPIVRLWGRRYVFRDLFGNLWEVEA